MPSDILTIPPSCSDLVEALAAVDDGTVLDSSSSEHIEQCLRCQAELSHYRRLRRTLRALAEHPAPVDPTLESEILLSLDHQQGGLVHRVPARAAATLGGLAAAAGVIVIATRHRRLAS